jgi:hypothetical protein
MESRVAMRMDDVVAHFDAELSENKGHIIGLREQVATLDRTLQELKVMLQVISGRQPAASAPASSAASPAAAFSNLKLGEVAAQASAPSPAESSNTSEQPRK